MRRERLFNFNKRSVLGQLATVTKRSLSRALFRVKRIFYSWWTAEQLPYIVEIYPCGKMNPWTFFKRITHGCIGEARSQDWISEQLCPFRFSSMSLNVIWDYYMWKCNEWNEREVHGNLQRTSFIFRGQAAYSNSLPLWRNRSPVQLNTAPIIPGKEMEPKRLWPKRTQDEMSKSVWKHAKLRSKNAFEYGGTIYKTRKKPSRDVWRFHSQ